MDRLLQVALNSRTNEANQLVKQGVRHFANEEYLEAEERFLRALDYDSTDYQVLMNLGFIAVHKGQPDAAFTYFKKALTLPDSLDHPAKARALWALARVHYSQKRFPDAYTTAKQAKSLSTPELAADVLTMGVYAAPLGKTDLAIQHCRQALTLDPSVFSTIAAYAELDLQTIRDKVMTLLAQMTQDVMTRATTNLTNVQRALTRAIQAPQVFHYADLLYDIRKRIAEAETWLRGASYGDCLKLSESTTKLLPIPEEISRLDAAYADLPPAIEKAAEAETRQRSVLEQTGELLAEGPPPPAMSNGLVWLLYLLPGLGATIGLGELQGILAGMLFWPFILVAALFVVVFGLSGAETVTRCISPILVGAAASAAIWFYFVKLPRDRLDTVKRENARRREKTQNSERQRGECCGPAWTLEDDIKTRRAKILQDVTERLSPIAGSRAGEE